MDCVVKILNITTVNQGRRQWIMRYEAPNTNAKHTKIHAEIAKYILV